MLQKKGTFRKVKFEVVKANGYGQYDVIAKYLGKNLKAHTTDATIYDWVSDDNDKAKQHEALKSCYNLIRQAYEDSKVYYAE